MDTLRRALSCSVVLCRALLCSAVLCRAPPCSVVLHQLNGQSDPPQVRVKRVVDGPNTLGPMRRLSSLRPCKSRRDKGTAARPRLGSFVRFKWTKARKQRITREAPRIWVRKIRERARFREACVRVSFVPANNGLRPTLAIRRTGRLLAADGYDVGGSKYAVRQRTGRSKAKNAVHRRRRLTRKTRQQTKQKETKWIRSRKRFISKTHGGRRRPNKTFCCILYTWAWCSSACTRHSCTCVRMS